MEKVAISPVTFLNKNDVTWRNAKNPNGDKKEGGDGD
jgi:hypothetical protein